MLAADQVKPLPALVFPFSEINAALRQFSTAKHVGKIVVQLPANGVLSSRKGMETSMLDQMGAYVIVGGLGALGTIAAKWLVSQGRKNIILYGRSGR